MSLFGPPRVLQQWVSSFFFFFFSPPQHGQRGGGVPKNPRRVCTKNNKKNTTPGLHSPDPAGGPPGAWLRPQRPTGPEVVGRRGVRYVEWLVSQLKSFLVFETFHSETLQRRPCDATSRTELVCSKPKFVQKKTGTYWNLAEPGNLLEGLRAKVSDFVFLFEWTCAIVFHSLACSRALPCLVCFAMCAIPLLSGKRCKASAAGAARAQIAWRGFKPPWRSFGGSWRPGL